MTLTLWLWVVSKTMVAVRLLTDGLSVAVTVTSTFPEPLFLDNCNHDGLFSISAVHVSLVVIEIPREPPLLVYVSKLFDTVKYFPFWTTLMVADLSPIVTSTCPVRSFSSVFSETVIDNVELPDADEGESEIQVSFVWALQVPSVKMFTVWVSCLSSKFNTVVLTSKVFPDWVTVTATSMLYLGFL